MRTKGQDLLRKAYKEMNREKPDLKKTFDLLTQSATYNNSGSSVRYWHMVFIRQICKEKSENSSYIFSKVNRRK